MRTKLEAIEAYLRTGLETFGIDPPDSEYQEGYMAALMDVLDFVEGEIA